MSGANATVAQGINDTGQIVGGYNSLGTHGFLLAGGTLTTLPVALAHAINDTGQIVGLSIDAVGSHGFLDTAGIFSTIDVPGASITEAFGINDKGQVVGAYAIGGTAYGFVDVSLNRLCQLRGQAQLAGGRRCREISRQQKSLEAHRHELIKELVRQKEGAIKEFDEELAKLGYDGAHGRKRSHHKAAGDKKPSE